MVEYSPSSRIVARENTSDTIAIHLPRQKFGEFIKNLLGQPYEISRNISGQFDVTQDGVNQIINLLQQRVLGQHRAHLVEFRGILFVEQGLEKKYTDIDAFFNFVQTGGDITKGVSVSLTYLVYFGDEDLPEKQNILFKIGSDHSKIRRVGNVRFMYSDDSYENWESTIHYRIESTKRSWGEDVERILYEEIKRFAYKEPLYGVVMERIRGYVLGALALSAAFVPLVVEYLRRDERSSRLVPVRVESNDLAGSVQGLSDLLYDYIESTTSFDSVLFYVAYFIVTIFFIFVLIAVSEPLKGTFVAYNDSTIAEMRSFRKRQRKGPIIYLSILVGPVAVAVLANYIFLMMQAYRPM